MEIVFTVFVLFGIPLSGAGYLAYRIKIEMETGRSYSKGIWTDRATQPKWFWFEIAVKAFCLAAFLFIPLSIAWISMEHLAE